MINMDGERDDPPKYEDLFPSDYKYPPQYNEMFESARRRSSALMRSLSNSGRPRRSSEVIDLAQSLDRRSSSGSFELETDEDRAHERTRRFSEDPNLGELYEMRETTPVMRDREGGAEGATPSAPTWKLIRRQSSLHSMSASLPLPQKGGLFTPLVKALQNKLHTNTTQTTDQGAFDSDESKSVPLNPIRERHISGTSNSGACSKEEEALGVPVLQRDGSDLELDHNGTEKGHNYVKHFVAFVWTSTDELRCVVSSMDNSDRCSGNNIPMNFSVDGGFSVCKANFCRSDFIFVSGGHGSTSCDFHQYDVFNTQWKQNKPLLVPRRNHSMVALEHKVYAIGGRQPEAGCVADVDIYNMKTGKWRNAGFLPTPVSHAITAKFGDMIYIIGGKNSKGNPTDIIQTIDCTSNTIVQLDNKLCEKVCSGKAISVGGTKIYVAVDEGTFLEYAPRPRTCRRLSDHGLSHVFSLSYSHRRGVIEVFAETPMDTIMLAQYKLKDDDWAQMDHFEVDGKIEHVTTLSHCPL